MLSKHFIGFEPTTVSLEGYCSIQTELKMNEKSGIRTHGIKFSITQRFSKPSL